MTTAEISGIRHMDWREEYKRKLTSAEEASKLVKSGYRVVFATGREPQAIGLALAARKEELRDVEIFISSPALDFGWYDPGWEDSFRLTLGHLPTPHVRQALNEKRADWEFGALSPIEVDNGPQIDVFLVEVSPPDEHGFCSFGASRWDKKEKLRRAKTVLAEVNPRLIRTYGDNFVHVSEIDRFVENPKPVYHRPNIAGEVPPPNSKAIADYVSTLVKDGDAIQIGTGSVTEWLPRLGVFDNKIDLGLHTEMMPRGLVKLVQDGVITGRRKTLGPGKAVAAAMGGSWEDMQFVHLNPHFELYSLYYINNPATISAVDNMVAINQALVVDLSGQISAQAVGHVFWAGEGGQPFFAIGALLSRGGRSVTVLPSTARGGTVSRIVPTLEPGTIVTLTPPFADYVVSEYGIARLRGKSRRRRAMELIAIAHPDFRAELKKQAEKLFWP